MQNLVRAESSKMWTRETTTLLIYEYEANDCLWKTNSPFYRNKQKRTEALNNIAQTIQKQRVQATVEDIKNKINGIRTQYVSELNKLMIAGSRGDAYEPSLWCFDKLSFLKPYTQPKKMSNRINWQNGPLLSTIKYKSVPSDKLPTNIELYDPNRLQSQRKRENDDDSECVVIKEENDDDIEIIEEDETLTTTGTTEHQEESHRKPIITMVQSCALSPTNSDNSQQENNRVVTLLTSRINSEITLVPKKSNTKRKTEDISDGCDSVEEKKIKCEQDLEQRNKDELENRIEIFGKFIMSQMKTITDKVLFLKLEHTIQNAVIEAQLKQIALDENRKELTKKEEILT